MSLCSLLTGVLRKMQFGSVLVFLLLLLSQSKAYAQDCVKPLSFEDTSEYALLEKIDAKSRTTEDLLNKFATLSDLGEAIRSYRKFLLDIENGDFEVSNKIFQRWTNGEGVIAQHLIISASYLEIDDIVKHDYSALIEDFLKDNKKFCWIETDNFIFKFAEYKQRSAQIYPKELELKEFASVMREGLWSSSDRSYLQDYFDLLRLGGIDLTKEELKIWSKKNASDDYCNNVAHCIERIRIEIKNFKKENSEIIEERIRKFDCEGLYVNSKGLSIKVNFCDGILKF